MRRDRNRTIAAVVLLAAILAGCSQRQEPTTPTATLGAPVSEPPTAAPSDAPTDPPDPYAIPANPKDIDEVYVERVLEALSQSIAGAAREVVRTGKLTGRAKQALRATHRGPALQGIYAAFDDALKQGRPERFFSRDATAADIKVRRILTSRADCVFTLVLQDTSGLGQQEVEPFLTYYHLGPKQPGRGAGKENPTPWMIVADGEPLRGGKRYEDPCD